MSRTLIVLAFVCITSISLAQDTTQVTPVPDDLYVEKLDGWFVIKPSIINASEALMAKTGSFNIVLQPNTSEILRTYFSYQFISLYFDYVPRSTITNDDNVEKGRSQLFAIGTSINTPHWFADLNYSHTKGYYITKEFRPDWRLRDTYLQIPDLHVNNYDVTIGYNTNPRLSLPASVSQTERQLKSAGAFLPKTIIRYYIIDDRTPANSQGSSNQKSTNFQTLLGAGFQYTLALKKSVYLVGAFTPAFGVIYTRVQIQTQTNNIRFTQKGPIYQWDGRFGFGYNGNRFFAGTYLNAISAKYSQGLTSNENQRVNLFLQVFVGLRIRAPKFISRSYDKIFL